MAKGKIVIISGPSGSGKTTLYKKLLATRRFKNCLAKSISVTSRKPRPGEKNGRDYIFVSEAMFTYKIRAGHFIEWQKVFDNYYGTPKNQVRRLLSQGKNVLLCIDVQGAKVVKRLIKDAVTIFIKTPSFADLEERLRGRSSEPQDVIELRLKVARTELKEAAHYDYVVTNDEIPRALAELEDILQHSLPQANVQ